MEPVMSDYRAAESCIKVGNKHHYTPPTLTGSLSWFDVVDPVDLLTWTQRQVENNNKTVRKWNRDRIEWNTEIRQINKYIAIDGVGPEKSDKQQRVAGNTASIHSSIHPSVTHLTIRIFPLATIYSRIANKLPWRLRKSKVFTLNMDIDIWPSIRRSIIITATYLSIGVWQINTTCKVIGRLNRAMQYTAYGVSQQRRRMEIRLHWKVF